MMPNQLLRFKNNLKYIVLDVESESLNLASSRPWEISWLVVENNRVIFEYQKFPFIHDLNVSKGAAEVTGFNYETYKRRSEDANEVYTLLKRYLYDEEYLIVGLNLLFFDIYQIKNFQLYLREKPDYSYVKRIYDCLALGRAFKTTTRFPSEKSQILPFMYRMCGLRKKGLKANLAQLSKDFDIKEFSEDHHHEGLFDVKITNSIFQKLINVMDVI